jgi:hypothetical protein
LSCRHDEGSDNLDEAAQENSITNPIRIDAAKRARDPKMLRFATTTGTASCSRSADLTNDVLAFG